MSSDIFWIQFNSFFLFPQRTGFSPRAVAHWAGGRKPSTSTGRRLTELKRIFETLEKLVAKKTIGPWLKESNTAFDGSTPLQVIERGETDRFGPLRAHFFQ
jgi:hypothetical protein